MLLIWKVKMEVSLKIETQMSILTPNLWDIQLSLFQLEGFYSQNGSSLLDTMVKAVPKWLQNLYIPTQKCIATVTNQPMRFFYTGITRNAWCNLLFIQLSQIAPNAATPRVSIPYTTFRVSFSLAMTTTASALNSWT